MLQTNLIEKSFKRISENAHPEFYNQIKEPENFISMSNLIKPIFFIL